MNVWSISTTVRNPERIPDFCLAIESVEGRAWDRETQLEFMYELIRRRFYSPQNMTDAQQENFDNPDYQLSKREAKEIFNTQNYQDPPMRGRTAMAPLRDIGVVRLGQSVELTPLGLALVEGGLTLQDVLLNYCLKWVVPTPGHRVFSEQNGFNIRPFVGSLALISRVNELWRKAGNQPVGVSREEFEIFGPTLIDYNLIDSFAQKVIDLRIAVRSKNTAADKLSISELHVKEHLRSCLVSGTVTQTHRNNLRDFGDNAIRYFRQTGFIEYRGAGRYVDIATVVEPQVEMLMSQQLYKPITFESSEDYFEFVADVDSFTPPWADEKNLKSVKQHLREVLKDEGVEIADISSMDKKSFNKIRGEDGEILELRRAVVKSRLDGIKKQSRKPEFIQGLVDEYSGLLGKTYNGYLPKPIALEFNTFKTFLTLNDAVSVKANYPMGDDGEPISTAPGGATDLICEYKDFVLSVEVTMSRGNTQWVMEGQPVQRHLRTIEDEYSKPAYALFLAPKLHADTVETFWIANVHGYQGVKQRIVPLEMATWCEYLTEMKAELMSGNYVHSDLKQFLEQGLPTTSDYTNSQEWKQEINSTKYVMSFK
jgi:hypothetical protein